MALKVDSKTITDADLIKVKNLIEAKLKSVKRRAVGSQEIFDDLSSTLESKLGEDKLEKMQFASALCLAVKDNRLPEFEVKLGKNGGIGPMEKKIKLPMLSELKKEVETWVEEVKKPVEAKETKEIKSVEETQVAAEKAETKPAPPVESQSTVPIDMSEVNMEEDVAQSVEIPPPPPTPTFSGTWGAGKGIGASWSKPVKKEDPTKQQTLIVGPTRYTVEMPLHKLETLIVNVLKGFVDDTGDIELAGIKYSCPEDKTEMLEDILFFLCEAKHVIVSTVEAKKAG